MDDTYRSSYTLPKLSTTVATITPCISICIEDVHKICRVIVYVCIVETIGIALTLVSNLGYLALEGSCRLLECIDISIISKTQGSSTIATSDIEVSGSVDNSSDTTSAVRVILSSIIPTTISSGLEVGSLVLISRSFSCVDRCYRNTRK